MPSNAPPLGYLDRLILIRGFPGMSAIAESTLALMAEQSVPTTFATGDTIYREGEPVKHVHLVLDGTVAIRRRGVVVARVGAREVCGSTSVFADEGDGPEAIAETTVSSLCIDGRDTADIFQDNFDLLALGLRGTAIKEIQSRLTAGAGAGYAAAHATAPARAATPALWERLECLSASLPVLAKRVDALVEVAYECAELQLAPGAALWKAGDTGRYLVIPVEGTVRGKTAGQEFLLGRGSCVGLLDALADLPRWHDADAPNGLTALTLEVDRLLDVLEDHAPLALALLQSLAATTVGLRKAFAARVATG